MPLLAYVPLAQAQMMPLTTTSDPARAEFEQGRTRLSHADLVGAREHLDAALAADPSFGLAHMYRAVVSTPAEEVEHMRHASAARVSEGERLMIEGRAAHVAGDHDREVALYKQAADTAPSDPHPLFARGFELYFQDRNAESLEDFRRLLTIAPEFAGAYNGIGYAAMELDDMATAEAAFRDYIRTAPDEANPYDSMGEFLMSVERMDEAEAQFEMALTKDPTFSNSSLNLARIGIERTNRRFEQAVANGDADAVAALYTAGAMVFPPDMEPIQGREAIAELFADFVAGGVDGVNLETTDVLVMGDYAHEVAWGTISAGGEVGDPFSINVLWMKVGGEWLLHRDIWNSNGPQTTSAGD